MAAWFDKHGPDAQQGAALVGSDRDETIGPGVIPVLRPSSYTETVIQPEATAFRLLLQNLQPLPPPNPFYPLMIGSSTFRRKQGGDPSIPIPPLLPGKSSNAFVSASSSLRA